jgi:hypothetical protein
MCLVFNAILFREFRNHSLNAFGLTSYRKRWKKVSGKGEGTKAQEISSQVSDEKILNDLREIYQYHHDLLYFVTNIRWMDVDRRLLRLLRF